MTPPRTVDSARRAARPRIHFVCPAGPLTRDLERFGTRSAAAYLALVRQCVPDALAWTTDARLFRTVEDEQRGGRRDDAARIRDLQSALDDPATVAIVAARGGAYLTRILPHLDFSPLTGRGRPLAVFGFSELTTLVNLAATYPRGRGVYWLCPNFLAWKIQPRSRAMAAMGEFWRIIAQIAVGDGADAPRRGQAVHADDAFAHDAALPLHDVTAKIASGRVRPGFAPIIGGCLSVLAAAAGTPLFRRLRPDGRWLAIEDIHEAPYRIDRYLATLKLLGWFERVAGVLVGDFHADEQPDQRRAVLELLRFHLPAHHPPPVAMTRDFGHTWPIVPVPIGRAVRVTVRGDTVRFGTAAAFRDLFQ